MSQSRQVLSMKKPNMTGPGMLPRSLMTMFWMPMASDLSSSPTLRRVAIVLGIVTQNVRKMRTKTMTRMNLRQRRKIPTNLKMRIRKTIPLKIVEREL